MVHSGWMEIPKSKRRGGAAHCSLDVVGGHKDGGGREWRWMLYCAVTGKPGLPGVSLHLLGKSKVGSR